MVLKKVRVRPIVRLGTRTDVPRIFPLGEWSTAIITLDNVIRLCNQVRENANSVVKRQWERREGGHGLKGFAF